MLSNSAKKKIGVKIVLASHADRRKSSSSTMKALGIEWKGDLVRTLNANNLIPPLGDVETNPETVEFVSDLIAQELERQGESTPRF
jgi:hypothetical protein